MVYEIENWGLQGKIISLNESERLIWGRISPTHATNMNDGKENWQKIMELNPALDRFPAFYWCDRHNVSWNLWWYLPSYNELVSINANVQTINSFLQKIPDAMPLQNNIYWSSTESVADSSRVYAISLFSGSMYERNKDSLCVVRAICRF